MSQNGFANLTLRAALGALGIGIKGVKLASKAAATAVIFAVTVLVTVILGAAGGFVLGSLLPFGLAAVVGFCSAVGGLCVGVPTAIYLTGGLF